MGQKNKGDNKKSSRTKPCYQGNKKFGILLTELTTISVLLHLCRVYAAVNLVIKVLIS